MERKLVKQGRNALTATLPAQWLRAKGLEAGDSVFMREKDNDLVISSQFSSAAKEITLDIRDFEKGLAYHLIDGVYIEGYDTITVLHNNTQLVQDIAQTLLGIVIEEHTPTRTVLKNIIAVPEQNFQAVMKRAAHILLQQARTLHSAVLGEANLDEVNDTERLLDYNLLYCLRYLNKYERTDDAYKYFLLCSTMELAGDQISDLAKTIGTDSVLSEAVLKGIEQYTKHLLREDLKKIYSSLRSFRNSIKRNTFAEGLAYALAETLYNYIGFLVQEQR